MKTSGTTRLIALLLAIGIGAAVFWWRDTATSPAPRVPDAPALPASEALRPLEAVSVEPKALSPEHSTQAMPAADKVPSPGTTQPTHQETPAQTIQRAIDSLLTPAQIKQFLPLDPVKDFARRLVATVDNLPREHTSPALWPIAPMPGRFATGAGDDDHPAGTTLIHASNAARYAAFVDFVDCINAAKVVPLYQSLYPLLQAAYADLGYPKASFHKRLLEVLDHLISLPVQTQPLEVRRAEIKGTYRPAQPWVTYEFTDAELNALSSGQKMLLRTGSTNHQRLQTKLVALKTQFAQIPEPQPH